MSLALASAAGAVPEGEKVFQVEILLEGDEVTVLSTQPAKQWTKPSLAGPLQLTKDTWRRLQHNQSELVAVLFDQRGKALRTYGYPGRYTSFFETSVGENAADQWRGGFANPAKNVRMLFLSAPAEAEYILFFRTEVRRDSMSDDLESRNRERYDAFLSESRIQSEGPNGVSTFGWRFLGNCPIPQEPRDKPPKYEPPDLGTLPYPFPPPNPLPKKLIPHPDWWFTKTNPPPWTLPVKPCTTGPGTVTGHIQLHAATPTGSARPYNMVIFGDGFTNSAADVAQYQLSASQVVAAMQTTPPYSTQFSNINIWRIDTECLTSGIANCSSTDGLNCPNPLEVPNTYYKITGCMESTLGVPGCNPSTPRYLGPTTLCPLYVAVEQELPDVFVDLRIVIANCSYYGGAAYPDDRLVVLPTCTERPAEFANLILHECGHTIAYLCDEYWVCVEWNGELFPNFATLDQVNADDVPWKNLDPSWTQHKHILGTTSCAGTTDHNWNPCTSPPGNGTISSTLPGAFWGCQFIDPTAVDSSHCCAWFCSNTHRDALGAPYFRPSPRCKMKELSQPFCYVCSDAIGFWLREPPLFVVLP
jgi:hypothetical protein